jgi:hypothetical protein
MRQFWLAAVLVLGLSAPGPAQDAGHRAVIEAQIAAFMADDFAAAFDFASPNIRAIFRTPERFGQMVVQGYPMVHRPAELRFLEQAERGGAILQRVLISDQAGRLHVLEYEMIPGAAGFVINGVRIVPGGGAGV